MNGTVCRAVECNLGNLVTDSMVYAHALLYNGTYWSDAGIALMQGGGIRSSASPGNITGYDLITMFPFNNTLYKIQLLGEELILALERSVERYNRVQGEFLQMAGLQVVYDLNKEPGHRVKSVKVVCSECSVPTFSVLDPKKSYGVIVPSFMYGGGDGYTMFNVSFE